MAQRLSILAVLLAAPLLITAQTTLPNTVTCATSSCAGIQTQYNALVADYTRLRDEYIANVTYWREQLVQPWLARRDTCTACCPGGSQPTVTVPITCPGGFNLVNGACVATEAPTTPAATTQAPATTPAPPTTTPPPPVTTPPPTTAPPTTTPPTTVPVTTPVVCMQGFRMVGQTCVDIDECASSAHDCGSNSLCINMPGTFTCVCRSGFTGADGRNCVDIDECATNTHNCNVNGLCFNSVATFLCVCMNGFAGNGTTCIAVTTQPPPTTAPATTQPPPTTAPPTTQPPPTTAPPTTQPPPTTAPPTTQPPPTTAPGTVLCTLADLTCNATTEEPNQVACRCDCRSGLTRSAGGACINCGSIACHAQATCQIRQDITDCTSSSVVNYCVCNPGYAGNGVTCSLDSDLDGIANDVDNCPALPNSDQANVDGDAFGDACDTDIDGDGFVNVPRRDACPFVPLPAAAGGIQGDSDGDLIGNTCDNCRFVRNFDQLDTDNDTIGDACDADIDGDGVLNTADNCPTMANANQLDGDADGVGDVCDNCPAVVNRNQTDFDNDGRGDICDSANDRDNDGIPDAYDNCPSIANVRQADVDRDNIGDACDSDVDGDGVVNNIDNCALIPNPTQVDLNRNGRGDVCDTDFDGDSTPDCDDSCPRSAGISAVNLCNFQQFNFDPLRGEQVDPQWVAAANCRHIAQIPNADPSAVVSRDSYSSIIFEGGIYVNSISDDDFIGVIFGFQSSNQFYLMAWKRGEQPTLTDIPFRGVNFPGVQLKLVNSSTGITNTNLRQALWDYRDVAGETTVLWEHINQNTPQTTDDLFGWRPFTAYRFRVEHSPALGRIQVTIFNGSEIFVQSPVLYNTALAGGRIGFFDYSQEGVIYSDLRIRCLSATNNALVFNGNSDGVNLPAYSQLFTRGTPFTIDVNVYPTAMGPATIIGSDQPTTVRGIYLTATNNVLGEWDTVSITSSTSLALNAWSRITLSYDGTNLRLFVNCGLMTPVPVTNAVTNAPGQSLYLGYLPSGLRQRFTGQMDTIGIWGSSFTPSTMDPYCNAATAALTNAVAYYRADSGEGRTLVDERGIYHGTLVGSTMWTESTFRPCSACSVVI